MLARDIQVKSAQSDQLESITFRSVRNHLEARMIEFGLQPDDHDAWENSVGEMGLDDLVQHICDSNNGAVFLRQLEDLSIVQMSKVGNVLPGIIDLSVPAAKADVIAVLVQMEKLHKRLQELSETLESNRGQLRMELGKMMRTDSESEIKACDSLGRPVANIKLELKFRPNWSERDEQFQFFEGIGQQGIIQSSVPWQTAEKVVNAFVDDEDRVVRMDREPSVETFTEARALLAGRLGIKADELTYVIYAAEEGGTRIAQYTEEAEFPFHPVCSLYQTVNAKVTKVY